MLQMIVKFSRPLIGEINCISVLPSLHPVNNHTIRNFKSEVNIEWNPPPTIHCTDPAKSGDKPLAKVDLNRPQLRFQSIDTLEQVSPDIKKLTTLEFAPNKKHVQVIKDDLLKNVQRNKLDTSSIEASIACLTVGIQNLQIHIVNHKRDVISRVNLKEKIELRKSQLKHLRRMDYKRYEWLLEKLDLKYHSLPNPIQRITRKTSLVKLTEVHCNNIRNERLEAYKKQLQEEKVKFEKEKQETLDWIKEEEIQISKLLPKE
nr:EOG090X09BQ [Polyphemus pediculus]